MAYRTTDIQQVFIKSQATLDTFAWAANLSDITAASTGVFGDGLDVSNLSLPKIDGQTIPRNGYSASRTKSLGRPGRRMFETSFDVDLVIFANATVEALWLASNGHTPAGNPPLLAMFKSMDLCAPTASTGITTTDMNTIFGLTANYHAFVPCDSNNTVANEFSFIQVVDGLAYCAKNCRVTSMVLSLKAGEQAVMKFTIRGVLAQYAEGVARKEITSCPAGHIVELETSEALTFTVTPYGGSAITVDADLVEITLAQTIAANTGHRGKNGTKEQAVMERNWQAAMDLEMRGTSSADTNIITAFDNGTKVTVDYKYSESSQFKWGFRLTGMISNADPQDKDKFVRHGVQINLGASAGDDDTEFTMAWYAPAA